MLLVDTSVWVAHFRKAQGPLVEALQEGWVLTHPFVIGELACGNLRNRAGILGLLAALPHAVEASHDEVLTFLDRHRLWGGGIGIVDAHLLASASLSEARLWTLDRSLSGAALASGVAAAEGA